MGVVVDEVLHTGNNSLLLIFLPAMFVTGLLVWLWFDTSYMIDGNALIYHSGPFNGKLTLARITKIARNRTMWIGLKPALAQNGMIVCFGKWNEIYIAPQDQEEMITEILKVNPDVLVT